MLITEDTVDYEDFLTEDGDVGRALPKRTVAARRLMLLHTPGWIYP